ncbi:MAG: S41 family peptidase [Verrucomicrobiia bacterium]|jgi:carboxyl-terminal processing protease
MLGCLAAIAAPVRAADEPRVITPTLSSFETLSRFTELLDTMQKSYVQPSRVNTEWYTTVALRAFVRSIDPEADLLTPEEAASTESNAAPADIGVTFVIRGGIPTVVSPSDGSPAQRAGLLAGDQIIAINNSSTLLARRYEMERLLGGPVDSAVSLRVVDPISGSIRDLHLHRAAQGSSPATTLRILDKGVVYYRLAEFSKETVENLRTAMTLARGEHVAGIILDLRNNPGGMFLAVQPAASIFLPKGAEIASLEYAVPALHTGFVSDDGAKTMTPIVVLVNGSTAAEAEVFAAALQDNHRAQIVGSKTFGRGFLAMSTRLANGSVLVMPTAYYMRPSKQILQDKGLVPDVIVELPRETERSLALAGFGAFDWRNAKAEVLATDLPLAKALSLLAK